ncbi:unnamed protein product [Hymenolepis diminuta]|uniref:Uncharacterized protein n=1 Tax=Hymenolepis diminuta TaxID=6216 RepID=A0A564Y362_HYMDI|nr:unnamed protein product [Hymenolepis diminuta]
MGYDYDIRYQRTEDFDKAVGVSHLIDNNRAQNEETGVGFVLVKGDMQHILAESIRNTLVSAEDIWKETEKDAILKQALKNPIPQDPLLWPQTETPWIRLHVDFISPSY